MKKIISLLLTLVICFSLGACGTNTTTTNSGNEKTKAQESLNEKTIKIEACDIIANLDKDNTTDDILIYNQTKDSVDGGYLDNAYFHYKIKSDAPTINVRVKVESQWGRNDITEEDFTVESDEIISIESDVWQTEYINFASNLYYWRITIYNGESEEVIGTKTIYTPFEKTQTTSVSSVAPKFHALNKLTEEEQTLFDLSNEAIIEYANTNHYEKFDHIFNAWEDEEKIYLCVQYKEPSKMIWFAIDKQTKKYVAHFNSDGIIPEGAGSAENCILHDYFYVNKSISEKMQANNQ